MADSPAGPFSESNIFKPNYIKCLILLILEEFQVYFYMKLTFKIESYGVRSWYFHDFLVSMSNIAKKKPRKYEDLPYKPWTTFNWNAPNVSGWMGGGKL